MGGKGLGTVTLPTEDEVLEYFTALSNSGRWGEDDQLGTMNFITNEKRLAACALVKTGHAVSLAWEFDADSQPNDPVPPTRAMIGDGLGIRVDMDSDDRSEPVRLRQGFASEAMGFTYHGSRITHIDALSHVSWDGKLYNGYVVSAAVTPRTGARKLDVLGGQNVVTRGVLIDVPRHRGIPWVPEGEYITPDEVQQILKDDGVDVEPGDVLFLRTGNGRRMIEEGVGHMGNVPGPAGYHVANMPFFHERGVAAIGADMPNDRNKSEYQTIPNPVHAVALTVLGMWIIDNCNLERVSKACEEHGTSVFHLSLSALPFIGTTGSPVNPIALF
jgi:kynurenine formamidase